MAIRRVKGIVLTVTVTLLIGLAGYAVVRFRLGDPSRHLLERQEPLLVRYVQQALELDTGAELWKSIPPTRLQLQPQTAKVPHGTREAELWVRAAYNNRELAVHLEFADDSEDRGAPVNPDACAVLFVPGDAPAAAQMMGYASEANVWQWLADRDAQQHLQGDATKTAVRELAAVGPGTQKPLKDQLVEGRGEHTGGRWQVVLKRRLESRQEGELDLSGSPPLQVSFAVWDGVKMENFARKSISILRPLVLEKPTRMP